MTQREIELRSQVSESLNEIKLTTDEEKYLIERSRLSGVHKPDTYRKIILRIAQGDSIRRIAREEGVHYQTIFRIEQTQIVKKIIERLRAELTKVVEYDVPLGSTFGLLLECQTAYEMAKEKGDLRLMVKLLFLAQKIAEKQRSREQNKTSENLNNIFDTVRTT